MNDSTKPKLSVQQAEKIISDVQTSDRAAAREAIANGVEAAQAQWIEAPLIAEALALELIEIASHNHSAEQVAGYLREVAQHLEATVDVH